MKNKYLQEYVGEFVESYDKTYLKASLEHQILELSRLVMVCEDEKVVLGISEALNALRGAVNSLKTQNRN